jgi:hypothetical protein
MGFEGIELSGSIEYHHFDRFQGMAKRKQLIEKLKGFGLTICGYNARLDFDSILNAIIDSGYADIWWTIDPCFWPQCHQTLPKDRGFAVTLLNKFNLG